MSLPGCTSLSWEGQDLNPSPTSAAWAPNHGDTCAHHTLHACLLLRAGCGLGPAHLVLRVQHHTRKEELYPLAEEEAT